MDKTLPYGLTATVEALITKDINAVRMHNANFNPNTDAVVSEGGMTRPRYSSSTVRTVNPTVASAIVLENVNKGYSDAFTFQLSKAYKNGLYGSLAYTYTVAKEVTANPGSQATSVWNSNPNVGTSNAVELANSQYAAPNRVVGNISYRKEYAGHLASTLSLYYEGSNLGILNGSYATNFSYVVNGDLNGDGNSATDLMYIPKNTSEMNFEAYSTTVGTTTYNFSTADQQAAFESFIKNSSYLSDHRGAYAGRNAALFPWFNRLDMRFLQDFFLTTGTSQMRHTLELSLDVLNFANLINKNWGTLQSYVTNNPLQLRSIDATTNAPLYRLQNINGTLVTEPFQDVLSTNSTWSMQLGLRYSF